MHYYQFNIADYRKDTVHLTPIEHYIYRQLIDWYYLDESPIPKETQSVSRRLCLVSENEESLLSVLNDFFEETENGWVHRRIESEIAAYHANKEKNRENGKKGGRPKKQQLKETEKPKETQSVNLANPEESQKKPNQEPLTKNQEPDSSARGSRLPDDWKLNQEFYDAAKKLKPNWPDQQIKLIADKFKDHWIAQTGAKACKRDWLATWRNWLRNEKDPYPNQPQGQMRNIKKFPGAK